MEADQIGRLRDILEAVPLIGSYLTGVTEADFLADSEKQDAVIRRIEVIGETTAHLTEKTRQTIPELPFGKCVACATIVAHDYANVDLKIVWEVGVVHMPEILTVLEKFSAR
jgi:uncharacterized protein with HEPN domain